MFKKRPAPMSDLSLIRHLKIFRLFGFLPFKLDLHSIGDISKPFLFVNAVILVLKLAVKRPGTSASGMAINTLSSMEVVFGNISPIIITALAIRRRREFGKAIIKLIRLQQSLGLTEYSMFRGVKLMSGITMLMASSLLVYRAVMVAMRVSTLGRLLSEVLVCITLFSALTTSVQFTYLSSCLGNCFEKLSTSSGIQLEPIQHLRTHEQIVGVALEINRFYDYTLASTLLLYFGSIMRMASYIYAGSDYSRIERVKHVVFVLFPVTVIAHILHTTQTVEDLAEASNQALLDNRINMNEPAYEDSWLMLHYAGRKPLSFKAMNTVVVNYKLGFSMIATFVTYTVVLYQIVATSNSP
ncbi:Hypothetical protein NTJ_14477 [Nesidiocoris tenuis]|uniref:Gustatory receptor n=1 Tax=Nesidiocoris tenuis TaxID=355587 RepID=A0ABN7BBA0_9HEMI|nr:Hypothetical protein NTJ_14477 [Nesidiocoris tenuis]